MDDIWIAQNHYRIPRLDVCDHQFNDVSKVVAGFFHIEAFSEAEVAQNIENEIAKLVRHVNRIRPSLTYSVVLT